MITYFKMKKKEWEIKLIFYKALITIIEEKKDILDLLHKMYIALKDVPVDELQKEFISNLVEIIHNENNETND